MPKPKLYYFNPTCEMAIANGTVSFQPNRFLQQFEIDLGILPVFLATPSDWVLMNQLPSDEFVKSLEKSGFKLPVLKNIDVLLNDPSLSNDGFNEIRPWGWSPVFLHKIKALIDRCSHQFKTNETRNLCRDNRHFYSRLFSLEVLNDLLSNSKITGLISKEYLPEICKTVDEIEIVHQKNKQSVLKAPWSSSGRGINMLRLPELNNSVRNKAQGIIKTQGSIMSEPLLNKLVDFSFQFKIEQEQLNYLGLTFFSTNEKGQYKGHYLRNKPKEIETEYYDFICSLECQIIDQLMLVLSNKLLGKYVGYFGVDAMLVTIDNELKIQPCVEINLRYNMGILAMKIAEMIGQQYQQFRISTVQEIPSDQQILYLTEITPKTVYAAYLQL